MRPSVHQTPSSGETHSVVRQIRFIDIINLLVILLIVGYVAYAKFFPFNVIDVTNLNEHGKIPMVTERVQAGTYAKYDIKTMRHTGDTITVIRNIVNGQTIPLSASLSNRPAGPGAFVVEVLLPPNLNPGKYHFRICYQAEFALDRTVTECFETESFTVFLPEGVSPDADGLTIPQDGATGSSESTTPLPAVRNSPGAVNLDNNDEGGTRTNLVETNETQQEAEGGSNGNTADNESALCKATGLDLQANLLLPIRIC